MTHLCTFLATFALTAVAVFAHAAELSTATLEQAGLSPKMGEQIDAKVKQLVDGKKLSGAVVIVLHRGKVVHHNAYGFQDIEAKSAMRPESIFRIYSMTKLITTVAVMQQWEQGKFKLDDPVGKYLPELADMQVYAGGEGESLKTVPPKRPLQVVDLIRHTSGTPYGNRGASAINRMFAEAQLIRRAAAWAT